jgi:hypothetical protein
MGKKLRLRNAGKRPMKDRLAQSKVSGTTISIYRRNP